MIAWHPLAVFSACFPTKLLYLHLYLYSIYAVVLTQPSSRDLHVSAQNPPLKLLTAS